MQHSPGKVALKFTYEGQNYLRKRRSHPFLWMEEYSPLNCLFRSIFLYMHVKCKCMCISSPLSPRSTYLLKCLSNSDCPAFTADQAAARPGLLCLLPQQPQGRQYHHARRRDGLRLPAAAG